MGTKRGYAQMLDVELIVEGGEVLPANSGVLAAASPVFGAMLCSEMVEGRTKKVKLDDKSKEAIELFLKIIHPGHGRLVKVTEKNVDMLLPLFDEYQVEGFQEECAALLLWLPATFDRMMLAKRFGLEGAFQKQMRDLATKFPDVDVSQFSKCPPDLLALYMAKVAQVQKAKKEQLQREIEQLGKDAFRCLPSGTEVDKSRAPYHILTPGQPADAEISRGIHSLLSKV
eukprot:TRINITY_DN110207_c0_g1_i1.p1 TRINITY_DN110207_c0_g1~~TRINITY_DN110207_c0_g1_i1.p1  ORF type:complete len:228 (-),score=32.16 TRINITY_DN110207_c0_g1_i1:99-782(-)